MICDQKVSIHGCDFSAGRDSAIQVPNAHEVNNNRMKPPFPEGTEMAMFGKFFIRAICKTFIGLINDLSIWVPLD